MWNGIRAAALALCVTGLLSACGGGGGGSGSSASTGNSGTFSASFNPSGLNVVAIAGSPQVLDYSAITSYTGSGGVYLVMTGDPAYLSAITGGLQGTLLQGTLTLRADLAQGNYSTAAYLHACLDSQCNREAAGSPVKLPVSFSVNQNIQAQSPVSLQRTGNDAAPGVSIPVTVPAVAGVVTLATVGPADVFSATFDGSKLNVATTQARAGSYTLQATLTSPSDTRFTRTVTVNYTVNPPAGGEQPMTATANSATTFNLPQGGGTTLQFTVSPPTWTSAPVTATLSDSTGMLALSSLGGNLWQVTANAGTTAPGFYFGSVTFSAGATGGTYTSPLAWNVVSAFSTSIPLAAALTPTSTLADLVLSTPVLTTDGIPATWSASTTTPWIHLSRSSGTTGTDALALTIDANFASLDAGSFSGAVTLSINRPGIPAQTVPVTVNSTVPLVQRGPASFNGVAGRIYIQGAFGDDLAQLQALHALAVTGASVSAMSYRDDNRYIGGVRELALDLTGATPGTPVMVSATSPLSNTQVSVPVLAPRSVAAGFAALPFGDYRGGGYGPVQDAFYFSAPGTLFRWSEAAGNWTLVQSAAAGLLTAALPPDEHALLGLDTNTVWNFDPTTLAPSAQSVTFDSQSGNGPNPFNRLYYFNAALPPQGAGLAFGSDERAIAAVASRVVSGNGVASIASSFGIDTVADLSQSPIVADPGNFPGLFSNSGGVQVVTSPGHHVVVASAAEGTAVLWSASQATWVGLPPSPAGTRIVAASDDGSRLARSDGLVVDASGNVIGNLNAVVPFTFQAGGYALSQDGRHALVYGYQFNPANGPQPASSGTLWVVDLSQAPATPLSASSLVATLPLASPVGCTTATLASGETCAHTATITVAPGSQSAFVLGPRGVAAVPLPASVAVLTAAGTPAHAVAQHLRTSTGGAQLGRPVGVLPGKRNREPAARGGQ